MLMPAKFYLFILFLGTKSQKDQTENLSSDKSNEKSPNIIATNFVILATLNNEFEQPPKFKPCKMETKNITD